MASEASLQLLSDPLYINATFIPTRRVDSVSKEAYFTILAVKADMTREVLAVGNNPTDGSPFWNDIFLRLKARGGKEVGLVVSERLSGIETVVQNHFKTAEVQLCTVHLHRECQKSAKTIHKAVIADNLKEVFVCDEKDDSPTMGLERWGRFCEKWRKHYTSFGNILKNGRVRYYFTYLDFDYHIRSMIHTTNWIERLNRDYKRTTRMRGALPNADATILLLGLVALSRQPYLFPATAFRHERQRFRWDF